MIDLSKKSKKANAFICGFGQSRRVVLSDTLVRNFTAAEIEAVVAHELGHYKNRDILKLIVINSAFIYFSFFIVDMALQEVLLRMGGMAIYDIAGFPIFALMMLLLSLLMTPALNACSRAIEAAADRFSIGVTRAPDVFISMMDKLGRMNLAEYEPSVFNEIMFYDHPPIAKRIKFARGMRKNI
jgi:STE24 endopeptidase